MSNSYLCIQVVNECVSKLSTNHNSVNCASTLLLSFSLIIYPNTNCEIIFG